MILSWSPAIIEPESETNFVFSIRDGRSGEVLKNTNYSFVILQDGQILHRTDSTARTGGGFESFSFSEDHTGSRTGEI